MIHIRPFASRDEAHLPRFLAIAAHEDEEKVVMSNPNLARYVAGFGRDSEIAFVAEQEMRVVGVAWARFWTRDDCGFGFMDETTPELAVAVEAGFQNQGIGARLVEALLQELRANGCGQVSLNVRADSRVVRLYERLGFVKIEGSERVNRMGGQSFNMKTRLELSAFIKSS